MAVSALDSALSGLRIAQQQLNVLSNNIANVSTPGYTRKILPQSTQAIAGEAIGVRGDTIIRQVDMNLSRDVWRQVSLTSQLTTEARYLDRVQQFHGPPDAEASIAAQIAAFKDTFSKLSDTPNDAFLLSSAVSDAVNVAGKINDFASLLGTMRNDAEDEIGQAVSKVNDLLTQIADINQQIVGAKNVDRSTSELEDQRDNVIKSLAEELDISFFTRGDGVLVVQTRSGVQLADENAETLYFNGVNIGPDMYYPASINGIFVGGDPTVNPAAFDIVPLSPGGRIGALLTLRDDTVPAYTAQLDELSYRMAQRFEAEGLRLFTDATGAVPADVTPVPNPPGPLTPVAHVGFSSEIRVNEDILADSTLLRSGTNGATVQTGSNEVLRRVVEFAFGAIEYQAIEGQGTPPPDIRVSANGAAGDTLQENFGLYSQNRIIGERNLSLYNVDMNVAPGNPFLPIAGPPLIDDFNIRFFDTRLGLDTGLMNIDLGAAATAYPVPPTANAAVQLVNYINDQIAALPVPAALGAVASLNAYGQLVIDSRGDIQIDGGSMGDDGLEFLGLTAGTFATTDPYFDIQVGNDPVVRISIIPGDDETDLVNKIDAIPGIDTADIVIDAGTGALSFRPQYGGDIRVTGGPFTSIVGFSTAGGNSIIRELFGVDDPVVDHAHPSMLSSNLGPGVNINSRIIGGNNLIDFSQKMVNIHAQDASLADTRFKDEDTYKTLLERQLSDESGVNLDEELSQMIIVQTAYSAAARAMQAVSDLFDDLMNAV